MLDDEDDIPEIDWDALGNVYVFANGKGGVGKTSAATNLAGLVAADGGQVLYVDVNGQGNGGNDLGYRHGPQDDEGKALHDALATGSPLVPVRGIRPGLDVIVGGPMVGNLPNMLSATFPFADKRQALALAISLAPIAGHYDTVFIDSAPENKPLQQLALGAARWMIAPTKTDPGSIEGLGHISHQFSLVRRKVNPNLTLLGVVLFATGSNATQLQKRAREAVAQELGTADLLFETFIRHAEAVGADTRRHGKLVHELEMAAASNPKFWDLRAGRAAGGTVISTTSASVAEDYANLAREILTRAAEQDALA
ncbi:ParA family protein [Kitasatospora sp. NPDC058184]|uniref:ParA family protein n=1 Tax=Kitasatospora sp. NPDC058184 TaxID=3346370 RepID=UPI0036DF2DAA